MSKNGQENKGPKQPPTRSTGKLFPSQGTHFQGIVEQVFPDPRPVQQGLEPAAYVVLPIESPDIKNRKRMFFKKVRQPLLGKMVQMVRWIQVKPVPVSEGGLQTQDVRHRDNQQPVLPQGSCAFTNGFDRLVHMFEDVIHRDDIELLVRQRAPHPRFLYNIDPISK